MVLPVVLTTYGPRSSTVREVSPYERFNPVRRTDRGTEVVELSRQSVWNGVRLESKNLHKGIYNREGEHLLFVDSSPWEQEVWILSGTVNYKRLIRSHYMKGKDLCSTLNLYTKLEFPFQPWMTCFVSLIPMAIGYTMSQPTSEVSVPGSRTFLF